MQNFRSYESNSVSLSFLPSIKIGIVSLHFTLELQKLLDLVHNVPNEAAKVIEVDIEEVARWENDFSEKASSDKCS